MVCRGIRGATTVSANTAEDILEATTEMLQALIAHNDLKDPDVIASAYFTTTPDLTATFPAIAARDPAKGPLKPLEDSPGSFVQVRS